MILAKSTYRKDSPRNPAVAVAVGTKIIFQRYTPTHQG